MRKRKLVAVLALSLISSGLLAQQQHKETLRRQLQLEAVSGIPTLEIRNINGSVVVEGYSGSTVEITVEKTIKAKTGALVEQGKAEIDLEVKTTDTGAILRLSDPCFHWDENRNKNWQDERCKRQRKYSFLMNFTVRVPYNTNLDVATVNQGEVAIKNVRGAMVDASNINGGIVLESITGTSNVNCINGDVTISYDRNPAEDSTYHSLNGDIRISFKSDLSADVAFKSLNGEIYTDFDITKKYSEMEQASEKDRRKGRYKIEARSLIQFGKGGVRYNFETLNGDVYIQKI